MNLCARDWQGKAGNRHGIARPRTATAMVGPAPLCNGVARPRYALRLLREAMRGVAWQGNAPETAGKHAGRGANAKND